MFFKKKEDKINYENIVEIWLTPKQYSTKYEVKTFYDKDNVCIGIGPDLEIGVIRKE